MDDGRFCSTSGWPGSWPKQRKVHTRQTHSSAKSSTISRSRHTYKFNRVEREECEWRNYKNNRKSLRNFIKMRRDRKRRYGFETENSLLCFSLAFCSQHKKGAQREEIDRHEKNAHSIKLNKIQKKKQRAHRDRRKELCKLWSVRDFLCFSWLSLKCTRASLRLATPRDIDC